MLPKKAETSYSLSSEYENLLSKANKFPVLKSFIVDNEFRNIKNLYYDVKSFYDFYSSSLSLPLSVIEFHLQNIEPDNVLNYCLFMKSLYEKGQLKHCTYSNRKSHFFNFLQFLCANSIVSSINTGYVNEMRLHFQDTSKSTQYVDFPHYVQLFVDHISLHKASTKIAQRKAIGLFNKHLTNKCNLVLDCLESISTFNHQHIKSYEDLLIQRVELNEIQKSTANKYLLVVKNFVRFLHERRIINWKYVIPENLRENAKRSNPYVQEMDFVELIKSIRESSRNKERDTAIAYLIYYLGCRPIEVSNLTLDDLYLSEKTLILKSVKSGQRKMQIHDKVVQRLKEYLKKRDKYLKKSSTNTPYVFITIHGNPITTNCISSIFYQYNIKSFNQVRINAKSLRHRFITKALDNRNDFNSVREAAGQKDPRSTMHYYHRSKERLLENSLPYNPSRRYFKR